MQYDFSTVLIGSVAGLSLASAVAAAAQCFKLTKRIRGIQAEGIAGDPEFIADGRALAARVSSMQGSITVLQSGMAELSETVANLPSRTENNRTAAAAAGVAADPIFDSPRSNESRKPRAQADLNAAPINLNRRGQMMRMHRRGESIPAIASALGISQGEVKLTVRMQELYSDIPEKENSHDRL